MSPFTITLFVTMVEQFIKGSSITFNSSHIHYKNKLQEQCKNQIYKMYLSYVTVVACFRFRVFTITVNFFPIATYPNKLHLNYPAKTLSELVIIAQFVTLTYFSYKECNVGARNYIQCQCFGLL